MPSFEQHLHDRGASNTQFIRPNERSRERQLRSTSLRPVPRRPSRLLVCSRHLLRDTRASLPGSKTLYLVGLHRFDDGISCSFALAHSLGAICTREASPQIYKARGFRLGSSLFRAQTVRISRLAYFLCTGCSCSTLHLYIVEYRRSRFMCLKFKWSCFFY